MSQKERLMREYKLLLAGNSHLLKLLELAADAIPQYADGRNDVLLDAIQKVLE
jgi:hypothetical protein